MKNALIALLLTFAFGGTSALANIDCQRDHQPVERLICSDGGLIDLDNRMSSLYFQLRNFSSRADAQFLLNNQRDWLADRNTCKNTGCLYGMYVQRIGAFEEVINGE